MKTRESSKGGSGRFYPAPLPKWELYLSYAVWIFHSIAAFVISYRVCAGPVGDWVQHWFRDSDYISGWKADASDSEWLYYRKTIRDLIIAYAVHSAIFHMTYRFLNSQKARAAQIVLSTALHVWVTSPSCILVLAAFAVLTIAASAYFRREVIAWVLCISFILQATNYVPFTMGAFSYYREFNMYLYGSIKILNVCIALCRNSDRSLTTEWLLSILHYMTYLPYSMTLIVLYEEFTEQIEWRQKNDEKQEFDMKSNIFFGARLSLWAIVFESLIHLIPVHALFASPFTMISGLNGYEMSSLAYVVGQYFHLKYVVIFGVPSLFARIDGLRPPPPPICISRVSRYSRMWRHFDAGLYSFLKNQVYVPLLTHPRLSSGFGRPLALISAFLVVVAWHGTQRHYVCWVTLSAFELVIERVGVLLWDTNSFQNLRGRMGELWLRRLIALSMLMTVIPGIFGVFFFLGNEGVGDTIFVKVLLNGIVGLLKADVAVVDGVPTAGLVFLNLIVLGYFFNHCCLHLEYRNRKAPEPHHKRE
ncbi:hypothetical protein PENTCL1PPCAC_30791 [Pristionchus entomophagus]|uniref:Uncharacterized protein n=1 Tax=Pristionchus entomophagus TaxID=358040 RepID=A0AAV5UNL2_9BILA|nr:hypothetical protein PENTCL1PPCAC_19930 [Pristionchus entomophagus]GMT08617.1 hypothetical protein PENTCL1PPCAC_30791 [Pristionchus entomophagus]